MFVITAGKSGAIAVKVRRDYSKNIGKVTYAESFGEFYGYERNKVIIVLLLLFNLRDTTFFFSDGLIKEMLKPGRGLWVRHHIPQP